jgi:hypothetical protein
MSAVVHGSYAGAVVIEDERGQGEVPLLKLAAARRRAEHSDDEQTTVNGRTFHRDDLIFADKTWRQNGLRELPSCWVCVDGPAVNRDHRDRDVCVTHTPKEG